MSLFLGAKILDTLYLSPEESGDEKSAQAQDHDGQGEGYG